MSSPQRPMSVVVQGLETTSDKIRALLGEGYLRTAVAQYLDVRYQHVRKVAVDAGIEEGLQRNVVAAPPLKAQPKVRTDYPVDKLVGAGFQLLGTWVAVAGGGIGLSVPAPRDSGVYAFAVDGVVKYVGLTRMGFHRRMYNYQRGSERQRTSHRINQIINEHVTGGTVVEIYLATPDDFEWHGLPVNGSAGLESGLIKAISPPWNKLGVDIGL